MTEIVEMKGRGHALTIDGGWRQVANTALGFVKRFTSQRLIRGWSGHSVAAAWAESDTRRSTC